MPSIRGMRTSMSTTSGATRVATGDGLLAVVGLADDLDVGLRVEDHAEAAAHQLLVVDDDDADASCRQRRSRAATRTTNPPWSPATGVERAAQHRDPFAHPDQPVPAVRANPDRVRRRSRTP